MRLAVVGKGGSGKSVVSGTLARVLARRGHRVLALDSDPMPGLAISLGLGPLAETRLGEAVEREEDGAWRLRRGIGPARAVQRYAVQAPDGVRLLHFGKATGEGLRPATASLQAFTQVARRLARTGSLEGWTLVGDLSAGPRQPAFDWAPYATTVLVLAEPSWKSVLTARRIARIARSRPGRFVAFAGSRVAAPADDDWIAARLGERLVASIPADAAVADADRLGRAPIDHAPGSPAVRAIERLAERLEACEMLSA